MNDGPLLYLWFDREPGVFEPDASIEDTPGTADIDLLTAAIIDGSLGDLLPARVHMSTHKKPDSQKSVRSIDIGKLLRDHGIQHRRCYQLIRSE
jgi:hypothetical protein